MKKIELKVIGKLYDANMTIFQSHIIGVTELMDEDGKVVATEVLLIGGISVQTRQLYDDIKTQLT